MDLSGSDRIVVVGAGQAAVQACASLRTFGFAGQISMVGDEAVFPYQRPPLSKAYMQGKLDRERLFFKPETWYQDQDIAFLRPARVDAIDRAARKVVINNGDVLAYDALILATGARPRVLSLPGAGLDGVFTVRSLDDIDVIAPRMQAGRRLVIVGAGYIGLEIAAVAVSMGLDVTVLEMADRVLQRVTGPVVSDFFTAEHRIRGVDIRAGVRPVRLQGDVQVSAVLLDDGEVVDADLVLVGIGILPNVELAQKAGLACGEGIRVNRDARTHDARIFAAGDCSERPLVHHGRYGRLESVHNAIEQGRLAAAAIMGKPRPPEDCPWFWSDQYDIKLQIAGLGTGYDEAVVRGDVKDRAFAVFYLRDGRLTGVDAINSPPAFLVAKKLIIAGESLAPATLRDTSKTMKMIAAELT